MRKGLDHVIPEEMKEELKHSFEMEEFFRSKMRLTPRKAEGNIIRRIEDTVESLIDNLYSEADIALERFYSRVRVPVMVRNDEGDLVVKKIDGKPQYKKDEYGQYIEDWKTIDGYELEGVIFTLQRIIGEVGDEVAKLYARAVMADKTRNDEYYQAWRKVTDGLKDDKVAYALEQSQESRWFYVFNFLIWHRLNQKLENLKETKKSLEFFRTRSVQSNQTRYN